MVFGLSGGGCDPNTLEQIMNRIRQKQAQLEYLKSQESVNPVEYEKMKAQLLSELDNEVEALSKCLRTIPKDSKQLRQQILGNGFGI